MNAPRETPSRDAVAASVSPGWPIFLGIALVAAVLLGLLPGMTSNNPNPHQWWNAPALAPGIALGLMLGASLLGLIRHARDWRRVRPDLRVWSRALLLSLAFIATILAIPYLGYGLSLLLFSLMISRLAGLRGLELVGFALGVSLLLVLLFRIVLGVWFPTAELFEYFDPPAGSLPLS